VEYKRQRLLVETRPDGREIFQSLDRAAIKLQRITDDDFREATSGLRPGQTELLRDRRITQEREQERNRDFYERGR